MEKRDAFETEGQLGFILTNYTDRIQLNTELSRLLKVMNNDGPSDGHCFQKLRREGLIQASVGEIGQHQGHQHGVHMALSLYFSELPE